MLFPQALGNSKQELSTWIHSDKSESRDTKVSDIRKLHSKKPGRCILFINLSNPVGMSVAFLALYIFKSHFCYREVDKTTSPATKAPCLRIPKHRKHRHFPDLYALSGHQSCDIPPRGVMKKTKIVSVQYYLPHTVL